MYVAWVLGTKTDRVLVQSIHLRTSSDPGQSWDAEAVEDSRKGGSSNQQARLYPLVEIMLNPPPLGMPFPLSSLYALRARGAHRLKTSEQVRTITSASFSLQLQSPHKSRTPSPVKVPTATQQSFTELSISDMTSLTGVKTTWHVKWIASTWPPVV